jgi:hypothetical protein
MIQGGTLPRQPRFRRMEIFSTPLVAIVGSLFVLIIAFAAAVGDETEPRIRMPEDL